MMRKPVSIALVLAAVCSCISVGAVTADAKTIRGDVNGDNFISLRDATLAQKIKAGMMSPTDNQTYSADFSANGVVELQDAYLIQKYVCLDKETLNQYSPNRAERIKFIEAVNAERATKGLDAIQYNDAMLEAGNIRAQEYQVNKDHIRPDNRQFHTVLTDCNLSCVQGNGREVYEKSADDTTNGTKLFNNFKSYNASSPVMTYMLSEYCHTICVGCVPDANISDKGYWIIVVN